MSKPHGYQTLKLPRHLPGSDVSAAGCDWSAVRQTLAPGFRYRPVNLLVTSLHDLGLGLNYLALPGATTTAKLLAGWRPSQAGWRPSLLG